MSPDTTNNKITFLIAAIADAQELIRFIDSKTAIAITLIGSYFIGYFTQLDKLVKYVHYYNAWLWLLISLFILLTVICVAIILRIIRPTHNPTENIDPGGATAPESLFFLPVNTYSNKLFVSFINSSKHKLGISYSGYASKFTPSTDDTMISVLSFELLKINFIRNIKTRRFNSLVKWLIVTTILFIASYILLIYQSQQASDQITLLHPAKCSCG